MSLGEKSAPVRIPTGLGIVVAKAAGFQEIVEDPNRVRHLADILTVGSLLSRRDLLIEKPYTRLEKQRVGNAIGHMQNAKYVTDLQSWFPTDLSDRLQDLKAMHLTHSERIREPHKWRTPAAE
ncbi:hypothetical protein G7067_01670 [Leucobacter insecticola]|uniref:Uncharacterized protein n=1 Tax=Leucobacter insecticola TaxID=2714934 RepID=A0A6G8FGK6_9MICO|nr:hypothetical protein [Leucobacter insecticola]QIM15403.1 hypothetical protein G7067_01670 [Leucobacter insecticola]